MTLTELLTELEYSGYVLSGNPITQGSWGDGTWNKKKQCAYKKAGNTMVMQWIYIIAKNDESEAYFDGGFDPTQANVEAEIVEYLDGLANGIKASGVLTYSDNVSNGDQVTIDSKTYTYQTTLTDSDGNVQIGASQAVSIANLGQAIRLGPGAGTAYAASMTEHTTVDAYDWTSDDLTVKAKTPGTAGNSIATTETGSNTSWGNSTLTGGAVATIDGYSVESMDHNHGWAVVVLYDTVGLNVTEARKFVDYDSGWQYRDIVET